jgi:ribosomal protein S27E
MWWLGRMIKLRWQLKFLSLRFTDFHNMFYWFSWSSTAVLCNSCRPFCHTSRRRSTRYDEWKYQASGTDFMPLISLF